MRKTWNQPVQGRGLPRGGRAPLARLLTHGLLVWGGLLATPALQAADTPAGHTAAAEPETAVHGQGHGQGSGHAADDAASTATEWLLPAGVDRAALDSSRLITASAGVTEIVCALGAGERIVAVDLSAGQAPCAQGKPQLGYYAQLAGEGVLAQQPTLILSDERIGPPTTVEQLKAAGVPIVLLKGEKNEAGLLRRIETIASILHLPAEGQALQAKLEGELQAAAAMIPAAAPRPKILVLLSAHAGRLQAAGTATYADALVHLLGGTNVCAGFAGYRPLTPESAVDMQPDWILVAGRDTDPAAARQMLQGAPALSITPAMKNDQVLVRPAAELLAFGPGLGETVTRLVRHLYGLNPNAK